MDAVADVGGLWCVDHPDDLHSTRDGNTSNSRPDELPVRSDEPLMQPHEAIAAWVARLIAWTRDVPVE